MELVIRPGDRRHMIKGVLLGVLLIVYAAGWLFTMIITVLRTGTIPPEMWLYLGIGAGGLLGVFKADDQLSARHKPGSEEQP